VPDLERSAKKMKMSVVSLVIVFVCVVMMAGAEVRKIPSDLWKLAAKSDAIVVGELRYDAVKGTDEYVSLELAVKRRLKSSVPGKGILKIRFYDRKETHDDIVRHFAQFSGKPCIVFTVQVDDPAVADFYLAGSFSESIFAFTPEAEKAIDQELKLQNEIVRDFEADPSVPHFKEVERLLKSVEDVASQRKAFSRLEALGKEGVPAIVAHMNDFRELPMSAISLRNSPGHWEAVRHYSPDKMVDALAAILNQVTHRSYRSIYNGGSDRERKACINAWRVHLHHIKNEAEQDGAGQPATRSESK
jgi:hypothetical protein